jgi:AraC-like DNA-binding protein
MGLSGFFVHSLAEAVERAGVPRERLFQAAAFDGNRLQQPDGRLSLATFDRLLDRALSLTGDEALGLHMGDRVNPGNYNLSALLASHAPSLRDAIRALQRFQGLLADRPFWRFVEDDRTVTLRYEAEPGSSAARRFRAELTILGFHKLLTYFAPSARPRLVSFDYMAPAYRAEYTRFFEGTERFEQEFIGIVFDRELLEVPQANRDPQLHATIISRAEVRVLERTKDPGYAERVRQHVLGGAKPVRHEMGTVARTLGLSPRTLRRRLAEEGTTFREIVDDALEVLAKRLVAEDDGPVEAAAYTMGFSHPSAFHRAFKRWTGATPAASRARRGGTN